MDGQNMVGCADVAMSQIEEFVGSLEDVSSNSRDEAGEDNRLDSVGSISVCV